jgi:hypothetical protein
MPEFRGVQHRASAADVKSDACRTTPARASEMLHVAAATCVAGREQFHHEASVSAGNLAPTPVANRLPQLGERFRAVDNHPPQAEDSLYDRFRRIFLYVLAVIWSLVDLFFLFMILIGAFFRMRARGGAVFLRAGVVDVLWLFEEFLFLTHLKRQRVGCTIDVACPFRRRRIA